MEDKPRIDARVVYGVIADTMPMEGRDFALDTAYDKDNKPKIVIRPLTDIGRAFAPLLAERIGKAVEGSGATTETAGPAAQEVVTVNSIRARIEQEAEQAHQARIADVERVFKEKRQAQDEAAKARPAGGKMSKDEMAAMRAVDQAARDLRRAREIVKKIPELRAEIDEAAKAAAAADAAEGRDWSVDMDAPLTSLFDRQDVELKFRHRETLLTQIAERKADIDELTATAVSYTKQYALPKKPAQAGK